MELGGAQEAQEEDPMAGSVFFFMPPQQVLLCDWLGSYSHRSRSVSIVIDSLPLSRTTPRVTNPSTLVSENVQTNDDTTVVWLSPL